MLINEADSANTKNKYISYAVKQMKILPSNAGVPHIKTMSESFSDIYLIQSVSMIYWKLKIENFFVVSQKQSKISVRILFKYLARAWPTATFKIFKGNNKGGLYGVI